MKTYMSELTEWVQGRWNKSRKRNQDETIAQNPYGTYTDCRNKRLRSSACEQIVQDEGLAVAALGCTIQHVLRKRPVLPGTDFAYMLAVLETTCRNLRSAVTNSEWRACVELVLGPAPTLELEPMLKRSPKTSWKSVYQRVRSADNARLLRIQPAAAEQKALQEDSRPGSKELSGAWSLDHASGRPPPLFPSRRELHCAATVPRLGHVIFGGLSPDGQQGDTWLLEQMPANSPCSSMPCSPLAPVTPTAFECQHPILKQGPASSSLCWHEPLPKPCDARGDAANVLKLRWRRVDTPTNHAQGTFHQASVASVARVEDPNGGATPLRVGTAWPVARVRSSMTGVEWYARSDSRTLLAGAVMFGGITETLALDDTWVMLSERDELRLGQAKFDRSPNASAAQRSSIGGLRVRAPGTGCSTHLSPAGGVHGKLSGSPQGDNARTEAGVRWRMVECGTRPPARFGHTLVGSTQRILLFGGWSVVQRGSAQQHDPLSDVWELDLRKMEEEERFEWSHNNTVRSCRRVLTHPGWVELHPKIPSGMIEARGAHSAAVLSQAYVAAEEGDKGGNHMQMVVFGGVVGKSGQRKAVNDCWVLHCSEGKVPTWQLVHPQTRCPSPRGGHSCTANGRRVVILGGITSTCTGVRIFLQVILLGLCL